MTNWNRNPFYPADHWHLTKDELDLLMFWAGLNRSSYNRIGDMSMAMTIEFPGLTYGSALFLLRELF
jgi:hypothetical protein